METKRNNKNQLQQIGPSYILYNQQILTPGL